MPELPEVQTVLDGVVSSLGSLRLTGLYELYPGTVRLKGAGTKEAFPARLKKSRRRGKYIIMELDSGFALIIHLRMTGKLVWDKDVGEAHRHERAYFTVEKGNRLRFIDPRTFGKITLCPLDEVENHLPALGAEPLEEEFDAVYLQRRLKNRRIPIKTALMDQGIVAGIGNIYACEILYRAGINPDAISNGLKLAPLKRIVTETKAVLAEALLHNGTSVSDFRQVDDKQGGFQEFLRVYQKESCPQGHPVKRSKHGGRSTFHCPICQTKGRVNPAK